MAATTEPGASLRERLEIFVKHFVLNIESEVLYNHKLLKGEVTFSAPEWSNTVATIIGNSLSSIIPVVRGLPGADEALKQVSKKIVHSVVKIVQGKVVRDRIGACSLIDTFISKEVRPKLLVETACDIFQCYENQFAMVEAKGLIGSIGWGYGYAMEKLARDAANRVFEYCEKLVRENKPLISLTEGVITKQGQNVSKSILKWMNGNKSDIEFGLCGCLKTGEEKVEWNSESLFIKVGIVHERKRYKLKSGESRTEKYGHRRLRKDEDWNQLKGVYGSDDVTSDYEYVLKPEDMDAITSQLVKNVAIVSDDQSLLGTLRRYIIAEMITRQDDVKNTLCEEQLGKLNEFMKILQEIVAKILVDTKQYKIVRSVPELADPYILRDELKELRAAAEASKIVVVKGLPGMGKIQLVRKYFQEFYEGGGNALWIRADSNETIVDSFFEFAETRMEVDRPTEGRRDINDVVEKVYEMLSVNKNKSLVVFANATDYSQLKLVNGENTKIFLPNTESTNSPNVIITSCHDKWVDYKILRLRGFTPEESKELVKKKLHIEDESQDDHVQKLVQKLAHYPLALKNALSHMRSTNMSASEYLAEIEDSKPELYKSRPESNKDDSSRALSTVMMMTYKSIKNENALKFLNIIAYLVPGYIPKAMFTFGANRLEARTAIEELKSRFIIDEVNQNRLTINPSVQDILRYHLKEAKLEEKALKDTMEELKNYAKNFRSDYIILSAAKYVSEFFREYRNLEENKTAFIDEIKSLYVDKETLISKDKYGRISTELYESIAENKEWTIVRKLIEKDCEKYPENDLCQLLDQADREDRRDIVKYLVKHTDGTTPSDKAYNCTSLLFRSASKESTDVEVAKYLLENKTQYLNGDPLDRPGFIRPSLLHEATVTDNKDLVRAIIQETIRRSEIERKPQQVTDYINLQDAKGNTALMWAAEGGRVNAAEVILEECRKRGEDVVKKVVDAVNHRGETALYWAAKEKEGVLADNKLSVAELLVQYGADVSVENQAGIMAVDNSPDISERVKKLRNERIEQIC